MNTLVIIGLVGIGAIVAPALIFFLAYVVKEIWIDARDGKWRLVIAQVGILVFFLSLILLLIGLGDK